MSTSTNEWSSKDRILERHGHLWYAGCKHLRLNDSQSSNFLRLSTLRMIGCHSIAIVYICESLLNEYPLVRLQGIDVLLDKMSNPRRYGYRDVFAYLPSALRRMVPNLRRLSYDGEVNEFPIRGRVKDAR